MTNEKAIYFLDKRKKELLEKQDSKEGFEFIKALAEIRSLEMAIKALEQQPCEDAVSRTEAIDKLTKFYNMVLDDNGTKLNIRDIVGTLERLPSVTPQRPKGKWKGYTHYAYHGTDDMGEPIWREVIVYHCSECKRRTVIKENYCPNCGAEMSGGGEDVEDSACS